MSDYRVEFSHGGTLSGDRQSLPVPDLGTALIVADINLQRGLAELRDGERLVATIEKRGPVGKTYWAVKTGR